MIPDDIQQGTLIVCESGNRIGLPYARYNDPIGKMYFLPNGTVAEFVARDPSALTIRIMVQVVDPLELLARAGSNKTFRPGQDGPPPIWVSSLSWSLFEPEPSGETP